MNVDRSRFLLLAAALSANACTIVDARGQNDGGPDATPTDTAAGDGATDASEDVVDATDAAADASDAAPDAPACNDAVGSPAACTEVKACLAATELCATYTKYFKPKVAEKAVACLVALPTCEGTTSIDDCGYKALEGACPDDTANAYCDALVAACPAADAGSDAGTTKALIHAQCKTYAPGLNGEGRTRLQQLVVTEGECNVPLRDYLPFL